MTKCKTVDRCITDAMVCNGHDDCEGDFTDEMYCYGWKPPVPPATISGGGKCDLVLLLLLY